MAYRGVFPVVPTIFDEDDRLDLQGQRRCVDFMIDAGSDGLVALANFSEQFLLSDEERTVLARLILERAAGRVPVVVTTTHPAVQVAVARSREAEAMGAAMVMLMPPYHGATLRVTDREVQGFFAVVSDAVTIPIVVQDAPVSGVTLPVPLLARMARELDQVRYVKIEVPGTAAKLRALIAAAGEAIEGPWDGEEAITLAADLEAGATGTITGGGYPDGIRTVMDAWAAGDREGAHAAHARWLPLINHENRQCGLLAAKALMREGGVIACDLPRAPWPPLAPAARGELLRLARGLEPLVLRWDT